MRFSFSLFVLTSLVFLSPLRAQEAAFLPACTYESGTLKVAFSTPPGGHIYTDGFSITPAAGTTLTPLKASAPKAVLDELLGEEISVYEGDVSFHFTVAAPFGFSVSYQACDAEQCYLPRTLAFHVTPAGEVVAGASDAPPAAPATDDTSAWLPAGFTVRTAGGYMDADAFLRFFNDAEKTQSGGISGFLDDPVGFVRARGFWLALLFVLFGGVLLNFTPCVLPMIPVSLAIIGAGGGEGRRLQGAVRGAAYGVGIAAVYGALGLAVVLTGGFFGAIQASPWFNLAVAVLFLVLALALFDLFFIDFSRFSSPGSGKQKQGVIAAFVTGAVSAFLAGACVAPVVLAVLLLTGTYYAEGHTAALLLPFLLGVGMALPWPFAGAGIAIAPRPGMWMVWVKYLFGAVLVGLAFWYGKTAFEGFRGSSGAPVSENAFHAGDRAAWEQVIDRARKEKRTVIVDFWATWCKNCLAMEKTTFGNDRVKAATAQALFVKVQAEKPDEGEAKAMLGAFGVVGLPGFAVLTPETEGEP